MSQSNLDDTDLDLTIVDEASCLTAPNEEIDEPVVTDGGTTLTNVSLTTSSKQGMILFYFSKLTLIKNECTHY